MHGAWANLKLIEIKPALVAKTDANDMIYNYKTKISSLRWHFRQSESLV
jgi:hypothetical protein